MPYLSLDVDYFDHVKTKRLVGLLGKGAAELPIRLWAYCRKNHPTDGVLAGYSPKEIETIIAWWGKPGDLIPAMERVGFMERVANGYKVHEWEVHQKNVAIFHKRARKAAVARWGGNASSIASSIPPPLLPINVPDILKGLSLYEADRKFCAQLPVLLPEWKKAYPGVDIPAFVRKMHAWEFANPSRRKVNRVRAFNNWLSKEQDKPKGSTNGTRPHLSNHVRYHPADTSRRESYSD